VRRGPAYTELTLYARVNEQGHLELVNHLGIALGDDPETMLARLERGDFAPGDIAEAADRSASDHGYVDHVRQIDAETPARFNADPARLFEASGSAGKVMLFAVRLDTFEKDKETRVFYIGTNDPAELTNLRRAILGSFTHLPVAGEYMHRTCFDIAARYGKDTYLAIRKLGTERIPGLFAAKARVDGLRFMPEGLTDKVIQFICDLLPSHLPPRLVEWRNRYEHHLILRMADEGIAEAAQWLAQHFPSATGSFFECTPEEAEGAFLHRFAAAGAANRYRAVHKDTVENIVALDIALPRNCEDWVETLPPRSTAPSCTGSITAISCAMCSIRTIS
jgi:D-lactate dehydrogenase